MKESNNKTEILISKYISGNVSSQDKEEYNRWLNTSSENKKKAQKSKKAWDLNNTFISRENVEEDKANVFRRVQKQQTTKLAHTRKQLLLFKIAALLAIPITFAASWYFLQKNETVVSENLFCEVTAPKGYVAKSILPDGTEVWVNTASTISYDAASFRGESRNVRLTGEAYFEVTENKSKPFRVITPNANINVKGTSFNVKAYPESNVFEAVLAEGNIEMELKNKNHQKISMLPGERVVYSTGLKKIDITKVESELYTSWRNGEILFRDATLNDLVKELERIYDIKFHLKDSKLGSFRFRGMFSYNNDLIDALEKIKRTANINYYIENKEVWLSGNRAD